MDRNKSLKGTILHATELLDGSYFENALIVVAVHDRNGAFGLLLNRPTHMPINEVFTPVPSVTDIERPFFVGGPVDEEGLHLLHIIKEEERHDGLLVDETVELGGEWDDIESLLKSNKETTFLFLGYSGWDSGQLEREITEGSWKLFNFPIADLLENWESIVGKDRHELYKYLKKV